MKKVNLNTVIINENDERVFQNVQNLQFENTGTSAVFVNNKKILPGKKLLVNTNFAINELHLKIEFDGENTSDNMLEFTFLHIEEVVNNCN